MACVELAGSQVSPSASYSRRKVQIRGPASRGLERTASRAGVKGPAPQRMHGRNSAPGCDALLTLRCGHVSDPGKSPAFRKGGPPASGLTGASGHQSGSRMLTIAASVEDAEELCPACGAGDWEECVPTENWPVAGVVPTARRSPVQSSSAARAAMRSAKERSCGSSPQEDEDEVARAERIARVGGPRGGFNSASYVPRKTPARPRER